MSEPRRHRWSIHLTVACALAALLPAAGPVAGDSTSAPSWRSPKSETAGVVTPFTLASQLARTGLLTPNALSTTGQYLSYLNIDSDPPFGTGKLYIHKTGDAFSKVSSPIGAGEQGASGGANPFVIRAEQSDIGSAAFSYVYMNLWNLSDPQNGTVDVARVDQYGGWTYAYTNGATNDLSFCLSAADGRYTMWVAGPDQTSGGIPIGGALKRNDGYTRPSGMDYFTKPHARVDATLVAAGVTSVACDSTTNRYVYALVSGAVQQLWLKPSTAGAPQQLPIPAPYDTATGLEILVQDMSPDGRYLVFTMRDRDGIANGGGEQSFVQDLTTGQTVAVDRTSGVSTVLVNSIADNGYYGVSQTAETVVVMQPQVRKFDGTVVPVGPAELRGGTSGAPDGTFGILSGDGSTVAYPTASPVDPVDANGVDDLVTVTLAPGAAPTADAGPDTDAVEGTTVTLDGTASSTNDTGQALEFAWDLDNDGFVDGAGPTFVFPVGDGPASRVVRLTVTDPDGSASDTATVTVTNAAPGIVSSGVTPTFGVAEVTAFTYAAAATDFDPVTYEWDVDGDAVTDLTGAQPDPHTFPAAGTYDGTLTVTDDDGATTTADLPTVNVVEATHPPTADAGSDTAADEGTTVTLDGSGSSANDPGQDLTYEWDLDDDESIDATGETFEFPAGNGPATRAVRLFVSDADGMDSDVVTVTVENAPPVIIAAGVTPGSGTAGVTAFTYAAAATDFDPVTYEWDVDGDAVTDLTGAQPDPHTFPAAGTYDGTLTVTDDDGATTTADLPTVNVLPDVAHPDTIVLVHVGALNHTISGTITSGNLAVTRDERGVASVTGSGAIPGANGGDATITLGVGRFWIFPIYFGTVGVSDPGANFSQTTVVFFGNVQPSGATGATASSTWLTGNFPWKNYTLTWTITDNG